MMASELLDATITCPACGSTLRPRPGEHCIYCSFASVPCPSVQRAKLAERQVKPVDREEE